MIHDLHKFLRKCQADGECLILFIDVNENMTDRFMQQMLMEDNLGMQEVAMARHPQLPLT